MSHQKVTSKFPTAERLTLSSQQDPPHPDKPPPEGRPFLLRSPPKPRRPKQLIEFEVAKRRGSTNSGKKRPDEKRETSTHAEAHAKSLNQVMEKNPGKTKIPRARSKHTPATQWRRFARPSHGVTETARQELSVSLDTQTGPGDDCDTKAAEFRRVRGRRYTGIGIPKAYSIKTIAEALEVSPRTIRRWIATRKLIAHQIDGVVRITDADFRAFLAVYRCA